MIGLHSDITVAGSSGIIAEVELNNSQDLDLSLARSLLQGTFDAWLRSGTRFGMLVGQDKGFLWNLDGVSRPEDAPVWDLPMNRYLAPLMEVGSLTGRLRHGELALLVSSWLSDLPAEASSAAEDRDSPLVRSGFLDELRAEEGPTIVSTATDATS